MRECIKIEAIRTLHLLYVILSTKVIIVQNRVLEPLQSPGHGVDQAPGVDIFQNFMLGPEKVRDHIRDQAPVRGLVLSLALAQDQEAHQFLGQLHAQCPDRIQGQIPDQDLQASHLTYPCHHLFQ